ncbi:MAG TPA: hypothetical protein VK809_11130 [Bacteroidia bacterium]|jgi:hypothetical protein|nr:hypothetical protein [Bacteroidia bacterium]
MKPHLIRLTLLVAFLTLFSNCKKPTQFKEVQIGNLFTMQVPTYLNAGEGTYPFPVAMNYSNDSAAVFLMVTDTLRKGMNENTLEQYYDSVVTQPFIDSAKISPRMLVKVNNDSAYTAEMTGSVNGVKVFYEMEAIATPERYFMILTWGKKEQMESLKPDMLKALGSFCDLSHKKI